MKKYLLLSFVIHCALFFFVSQEVKKQHIKKEANGEIENRGKGQMGSDIEAHGVNVEILEMVPSVSGKSLKDEKKFYWGLGISVIYTPQGIEVVAVARGYGAEAAGLQEGDVIVASNGQPLSYNNDLAGDGPKKMLLTIIRKGVTIFVLTERTKVYY